MAPDRDNFLDFFTKSNPAIKIRDVPYIKQIVHKLVTDGPNRLQIISDFDHTLSKAHVDGVICPPSAAVISSSSLMPKFFRVEIQALFEHYYPIETSTELSTEEKVPLVLEWFRKHRGAHVAAGLDRNRINDIVMKSAGCTLRDNFLTTLQVSGNAGIPFIILSAGWGDIIKQKLDELGADKELGSSHVHIVSNFMEFDPDTGKLLGWKDPVIHPFNKNESTLPQVDGFRGQDTLKRRSNVILIGDVLADLDMTKGVQNIDAELKIGFLNDKVDERLELYMNAFDIVLVKEESMDPINSLLTHINEHTN